MRTSTLYLEVLPEARGLPADSPLLPSLLSSLRNHGEPGHVVQFIKHNGPETTDNWAWRVRVYLDADGKVENVKQACLVELPEGFNNGWELDAALKGRPKPPRPVNGVVGLINFPNRTTPPPEPPTTG